MKSKHHKRDGAKLDHLRVKGHNDSAEPVNDVREAVEEAEDLNDDEMHDENESGLDDRNKGHIRDAHALEESGHDEEGHEPVPAEKGVHGKKHTKNKVKYHQKMNREGRPPIRIPVPNGLQAKQAQDNKF